MSEHEEAASPEGCEYEGLDDTTRAEILAVALDYRGDVTLRLSTGDVLVGYVYANETTCDAPFVSVFPADGGERVHVPHGDLVGLTFSGEDKAAGRSWDAWVKRHAAALKKIEQGLDPGDYEPRPALPD